MGLFEKLFGTSKNNGTNDNADNKSKDEKVAPSARDALLTTMNAALAYNTAEIADEDAYKESLLSTIPVFVESVDAAIAKAIAKQCESRKGKVNVELELNKRQDSDSSAFAGEMATTSTYVRVCVGRLVCLDNEYFHRDKEEYCHILPTVKHRQLCLEALRDYIAQKYGELGYVVTEREPYRAKPHSYTTASGQVITDNGDNGSTYWKLCDMTLDWSEEMEEFEKKMRSVCDQSQIDAVASGVPLADVMA